MSSPSFRGGLSSTASSAAKSWASSRAGRYRGSWAGKGGWAFEASCLHPDRSLDGGLEGRGGGNRGAATRHGPSVLSSMASETSTLRIFYCFSPKRILSDRLHLFAAGAYVWNPCPLGTSRHRPSIVLTAIWCATEWTAWRSAFRRSSDSCGSRWRAGRSITRRSSSGGGIAMTPMRRRSSSRAPYRGPGGFISIAVAITLSVASGAGREGRRHLWFARWAEPAEIRAAGLLGADGVILGRYDRDYLRHDGPSMSCASRRPDRAKASASWCPRC